MLIVLLRHAEAEERSATGLDTDRRLTAAGKKRSRLVAKGLATLVPSFDRVFVSPLVRAHQTAAPILEAAGFLEKPVETPALRPGASPGEILRLLRDQPASSVLLVGHQPHLGALFGQLLGGAEGAEVPMKKASAAAFAVVGDPLSGHAELQFYLPPKVLERLA
jgi:phosphohistidine phosphatase